jgi:hypothetical protein
MSDEAWPALTDDREKSETYRDDPDVSRGLAWARQILGPTMASTVSSHALLLIQPDCFARRMADRCVSFASRHGFRPVHAMRVRLEPRIVSGLWFYQSDTSSPDSLTIAELVCGRSDALLVLFRDDAPETGVPASLRLTRLKGPSDPGRRTPDQLRSVIGAQDRLIVLIHTSDEPIDVIRESAIICGPSARELYLRMAAPPADDAAADVAARIAAITGDTEAHDLDPAAAMRRLSDAVAAAAHDRGRSGPAGRVRSTLARVAGGDGVLDWTSFAADLRDLGIDATGWDALVLGSRYIAMECDAPRRFAVTYPLAPNAPSASAGR